MFRKNIRFFLYFFIFLAYTCEADVGDIQKVKAYMLDLEECLLPEDHPLQSKLKDLFKNPEMFESKDGLKDAGFHPFKKRSQKVLMVASHPDIKNYLIKKFKNKIPQKTQLDNYLVRISGARALRQFIEINNLQHIVVPQKWLYRLPKQFADPKTGKMTYVLIVEEINICSGGNSPKSKMAQKYNTIDFDVLRELCIVVYYFRGLDSTLRNMPFTHQNSIAFIDTEKWPEVNRDFLWRASEYLTPDKKEYALALFEELRAQDNK